MEWMECRNQQCTIPARRRGGANGNANPAPEAEMGLRRPESRRNAFTTDHRLRPCFFRQRCRLHLLSRREDRMRILGLPCRLRYANCTDYRARSRTRHNEICGVLRRRSHAGLRPRRSNRQTTLESSRRRSPEGEKHRSPTVYDSRIYVPMSSMETTTGAVLTYECCTFRGHVTAL